MTIQLLVNIAADDPQLVSSLNGSLPEAIHVLAADALKAAFQRTPFKIQSDVIALLPGVSLGAQTKTIVALIADRPLLTKSDLARRFNATPRTLERWINQGKLPRPIRVKAGPRWRPEDIAQFERTQ